jgi:hypothetical protein
LKFYQKYIRQAVLLSVFALTIQAIGKAQPDFKYKFISKVVDADSMKAIKDCHIINKTQQIGTVSDANGQFILTANLKDSLEFSIIGYEKLALAVHDSMFSNTRVIRLKPATYALGEVNIGLLSTYGRFKRDVLNRKTDSLDFQFTPIVSRFEVYTPPLPNQGGINIIPDLVHPVTALYNLLSKEGKQLRYYSKLVGGTAEHVVIGNKFNGLIVKQITGLEDDELVKFMSFCMFTKEYLLVAPQEEINRAVRQKFYEYLKRERS